MGKEVGLNREEKIPVRVEEPVDAKSRRESVHGQ